MEIFKKFFKTHTENNTRQKYTHNRKAHEVASQLQQRLNLYFSDVSLIITALKHRSYLNVSNEDRIASNERLEFLGDAVLDLIVTHFLYNKFPKRTEGQLSKIKSILISKPVLAEIAMKLELGDYVLINKGEEKTGGRKRQSILADCFEAIIGAIYLDKGLEEAQRFVETHLLSCFKSIMQRELFKNYKSILLEYAQSQLGVLPEYRLVKESGPDHDKKFEISVFLKGEKVGTGVGRSKKTAEQEAAKIATRKLGLHNPTM